MKKFIFVFVLLLISVRFYAQAPEKVNYQAVARNLAGAPLINQTINVKYEIRQGSTTGVVVYAENHVLTTNQFGLFTAEIGGGTVITGSFPGIAWGTSPFYLFVEVDGDPMGVTQLLSVPYALYAKESGNGPAGLPGKNSLSVSSAYSGPMCSANGGSQIDVGLDDNNDGILQPIEIDFTYYVCNGTDGVIGSNGLNTLSSTVASTSCTNGGVTVNMGLDANNNNILEASEISVSYDVCNGTDGLPGTNGTDGLNILAETIPSTSCPNGGVTVNMGQDINNNGILETGEITTTYDVCNGVDGTSGTTYFAGNGISLSGDTITNIGDADADPTNELQNLSISNDTLYISGGNQVIIPSLTETTTTLIDNGNGTFTYTDETGTPITFDANIDDADADATNELQVLSFSNDTLYLSNGNSVYITPSAADNWGSDFVNTSGTNISGDGTAGNPLTVTETTTTLVDNGNGTFTYTDETGTPITFDANIDDADADATNELQVLSFSNDTLYLSNGNSVYITPSAADNWGSDFVNTSGTNISGDGTAGNPLTVTETTTTLVDNGNGTFTYTDETGTPITFDANIDDADADATNELQVLSFSNDTLYLSNGNSVYITPSAADNWGSDFVNTSGTNISGDGTAGNPLTVTETTSSLVDNADGTFTYTDETGTPITFDANIDDADADATNELQVLSFSNDTLYLSNGNSVYITSGAGDNWGTDVVNTSGTNISGDGTAGNPLTVTETTSSLVDNADGTFTYTDETGTPITFDANIDDADADATNELQVLSLSNDTLYLSNGNSVYITPGAGDNWGTDVVNTSGTNISGDGTAGNPLTVTETTSSLVDNADGTFTYTDETGTPITFDANIDDADADPTNELELPMIGNTPGDVLIWNGSSWVAGTDQTADGDTDPNNELELPTIGNTPGDVLVWNGTNWVAGTDQTADGDTDPNNEIELPLSASPGEVLMWNGSNWAAGTDQTADGDTDSNNEIQDISLAGTNLSITSGSTVDLSTITGTDSQDLDLSGNTLSLTNDATPVDLSPYLDNTDNQTLSISNDTLFLTNGGSVVLPSKDSTNIYNSDGTLTGARTVTQNANNITYIGGGINPTAIFRNGNALGSKIQIDATNAGASPSVNLTNNGTNWGGISGTANGLQLSGGTGGNVGIGVSPANGRFVVQHAATAAYPSIKLNQTDLNLNRIHFTNTPVANKYWEIAAETDASDVNAGYSINYFNGTTYNIHFLTYGNGRTAINGSGFVPAPNSSMFDVFGTTTIHDSLSIKTSYGSGYTFPVIDGSPNYLMQTDGSGNLSWVDPSSLGNSGWSLTGNTGTGASNFIGTTDAQDLRFRTNNTEKMVITQSGNVGMGVAAPLAHLHISRDGNAVAGIMSAGGYGELTLLRSNGTKASPSHVLTNDQIGTLDFVGYNSVQGWTGGLAASIEVFATEDYSASGFKGSKMAFNVSQNGGAGTLQAMTIDNFGRIGIGVTSPLQLVDIEGGENSGIDLTTGAIKLRSSVNSIAGAQFGTVSSHSLDFITSNNSRIRIASSGEVGVGTTSPTAVLHLEGSLRLNNLSGNAPIAGYILTSMDAQGNAEWTDPSLLSISGPWTKTSNYVYPTTLSDSIGIGTNFPAQKLHVADGQILNNWSNPNGDANLVIRNWNSGSGPGYNTGTLGQVTIATSDAAENKYAIQGYSGGDGGSKYGFYGSATGTGGQNYGGYFSALQGTNNTGVSSIAYADFTSNSNAYGLYTTAQGDGAGTTYGIYAQNASTVTGNTYAGYFQNLNSTGSTIYGVRTDVTGNLGIGEKYGINSSVTGSALRNYAGYFSASGATNNWAGYFAQGNVFIQNTLVLPTGAVNNYILKTDATGNASWADPSTLGLGGPWTKSGNDIYPTNFATENVAIGTNAPGAKLHVQDNLATNGPLFRIKNVNLSFPSTMAFTSGNDTYNYIMGVDPNDNSFKISNSLVNLNAANRLTISSAGDVGIGTTAPNSKLNVNGDLGLNDGSTVASNNAVTILLTNSGPAVAAGDIVVVGTANNSFNVTNNPGHYAVIGVAVEAINGGSVGKIAISGVATVNIESASNVIRGQHCITGNSNGRASGISIPSAGTSIGVYLTDGPADGTAKVLLR